MQANDRAARKFARIAGLCAKYAAIALVFLVVIVAGLLALATSDLVRPRLETAARAALSEAAGADIATRFSDVRLVLSGNSLFGLEFHDVQLATGPDQGRRLQVERMHFGIDLLHLARGGLRLTDASLSGVDLTWTGDGPPLGQRIADERGLVDPDLVARETMALIERIATAARVRVGGEVSADAIRVEFLEQHPGADLVITEANVERDKNGHLVLTATGAVLGTPFSMNGRIAGRAGARSVEADIDLSGLRWQSNLQKEGVPFFAFEGNARIRLQAEDGMAERPREIHARLRLDDLVIRTAERESLSGDYSVDLTLTEGAGKVEINHLLLRPGQSVMHFHGAVGPMPREAGVRAYRYELVSDGSRIAPEASPEVPLSILARVGGILDPFTGRYSADEISVRTSAGDVVGDGALVFTGERSPAIFLAISAASLPISHAKQLWPWKAADGARNWVLGNVYGGTLERAEIRMSVDAGRIGDGIPFGPDEISGQFQIRDSRFDMAGELPPVRDAAGSVEFRGRYVDIALHSGTVYMPSGRTVAGSNGRLEIEVVRGQPLLGKLRVDVSGTADAVTEFAILEPISVGRFVELMPNDFSGDVTGTVAGTIPLQKNVDPSLLSWEVSLGYDALSIARPFDGHLLSKASGTLYVDRSSAVIEARGLLNGLPAHFSVVEPLLGSGVAPRRDIRLQLDDKALAQVAPGLSTIVSGKLSVAVDGEAGGPRRVTADLTNAVLKFPWAGWRKGAGIPAEAKFVMEGNEGRLSLSDLTITGEGFFISGKAIVSGGRIESALFDRVELNRGDRFRLMIDRRDKGYALEIDGDSIDARSMIRQILSKPEAAQAGLEDTPIWLTARSDKLVGFGSEQLSDVSLNYVGHGARIIGLDLSAATRSGSRLTVRADETEGRRSMQMQSVDAGAVLRFLDIYQYMHGGSIDLRVAGELGGPLRGQVDARDFWLVNEPRLRSLVASTPEPAGQGGTGTIDVSRARFERGFARLEKGDDYLNIADGVLRGVEIGSTFQGTLYDPAGQMAITGTFMPAYGLNRMFAQIPIVGILLGNGRDRALIGITYKLSGDAKAPRLTVNPISAIAPGIFRSIFEFR